MLFLCLTLILVILNTLILYLLLTEIKMKMMSNQSYGNFIHPHLNDPQAQTVSAKMKNMNQTKFRENMRAFK